MPSLRVSSHNRTIRKTSAREVNLRACIETDSIPSLSIRFRILVRDSYRAAIRTAAFASKIDIIDLRSQ